MAERPLDERALGPEWRSVISEIGFFGSIIAISRFFGSATCSSDTNECVPYGGE